MEVWLFIKEDLPKMAAGKELMSHTLPGLPNFYQVGQWVEPGGGLPSAATSARGVIQAICKKDARKFTTSVA